ncbi:MAG: glycosylphosphatidylinositol specific phospholipase d1 [Actinomycetia bacterium]|nr:glycosylphosphatidylinositol specific phospholipase d1 [Actinomycetes bacterium]
MSHEHAAGATGAGTVILELGGDVGVLVLVAPAPLLGREIEISPADDGDSAASTSQRTHSLVRERITGSGKGYAAVYPGIPAGRYIVWRDADTPAGRITIEGGEVARFTLADG